MAFLVNDHGYIVYEDQKRSSVAYLEKIRQTEKEKIENASKNVLSIFNDRKGYFAEAGQRLIDMGEKEEERERALIDKAFGENTENLVTSGDFIRAFNEILVGKERLKQAVVQIQLALENKKTTKKQLAPSLSSLYLSKLNKELGIRVNEYIHAHEAELLAGDTSDWEEAFKDILLRCAEDALEELLTKTNNGNAVDIFGTYVDHQNLFDQYKEDVKAQEIFADLIRKKVDLDKISKLMKTNIESIKERILNKKKMTGWTWSRNALSVSNQRTGQMGGSINEFLNQLAQQIGGSKFKVNIGDRAARTFMAETQKIDNVLFLSLDGDLDLSGILEDLDNELGKHSQNLIEAAKTFSDYYENNLKNLTDSFIVYTSGKAYGLNEYSSMGFTNDSNRSIQDLPAILSYGQDSSALSRAQDFIDVVINTLEGAVLGEKASDIKEALRIKIYESMAYLMFDDWISLGSAVNEVGANAIHAVTLNDVIIPFSVLLKGAGQALMEAQTASTEWFRIKIMYKEKTIKYQTAEDYPKMGESTKNNKFPNARQAWEDQRTAALDNITFTTHFMSNFWNYINSNFNKLVEANI